MLCCTESRSTAALLHSLVRPFGFFLLQLPAAEAFVRPWQLCKRSPHHHQLHIINPNDWTSPKPLGSRVHLAKAIKVWPELADITRISCKGHVRILVNPRTLDRPTTARCWPHLLDVSVRDGQRTACRHNATDGSPKIPAVSASCPAFKASADACGWLSQFRRHAGQKATSRAAAAAKKMGHRFPDVQKVSPGEKL